MKERKTWKGIEGNKGKAELKIWKNYSRIKTLQVRGQMRMGGREVS